MERKLTAILRIVAVVATLALGLLAGPLPAAAQQAGKVSRVGLLTSSFYG